MPDQHTWHRSGGAGRGHTTQWFTTPPTTSTLSPPAWSARSSPPGRTHPCCHHPPLAAAGPPCRAVQHRKVLLRRVECSRRDEQTPPPCLVVSRAGRSGCAAEHAPACLRSGGGAGSSGCGGGSEGGSLLGPGAGARGAGKGGTGSGGAASEGLLAVWVPEFAALPVLGATPAGAAACTCGKEQGWVGGARASGGGQLLTEAGSEGAAASQHTTCKLTSDTDDFAVLASCWSSWRWSPLPLSLCSKLLPSARRHAAAACAASKHMVQATSAISTVPRLERPTAWRRSVEDAGLTLLC